MPNLAERILVIDPQKEDLLRLSDYLEAKGYGVKAVPTIAAAQEVLKDFEADLLFADVTNEDVANIVTPDVPLVVVSQTPNSGDVVACLRAGASDFILKPVRDFASVDHVIDRILDKVRLAKHNKLLQEELENGNKKLSAGIKELRADQKAGLQVQRKMLPKPEKLVNRFQFEHRVKPSLYLSGDFLDYFNLDDHRSLFYFADVSGHGASSAFVTVLLKNLTMRLKRNFKRGSSDEISCPAKFLYRMNQELLASTLGKHVTVFAGILDECEQTLRYSVGGHFPLPVYSVNEQVEFLAGKGMAVGLFEEPEFLVYSRPIDPGFRITIFSDGILEVMPGKNLSEKEEILLEVVSKRRQSGISGILTALGMDKSGNIPDDIAVLTVSDKRPV